LSAVRVRAIGTDARHSRPDAKQAGTIEVFGEDLDTLSPEEHRAIERRWGVMFQGGALFPV